MMYDVYDVYDVILSLTTRAPTSERVNLGVLRCYL